MNKFRICLFDTSMDMIEAWEKVFGDRVFSDKAERPVVTPAVEIIHGDIIQGAITRGCQTIVSPGNSFGFMDGGLDLALLNFFGVPFGVGVRERILDHWNGELVVGNSDVCATGHKDISFMIIAPTMRVPMLLPHDSIAPYHATKAAVQLWKNVFLRSRGPMESKDNVYGIAIPGMGTGVGGIPFDVAAKQMEMAVHEALVEPFWPINWREAQRHHQSLYGGDGSDLQNPKE